MSYVESNRTVEPHPESILILYLLDGNGVPVPNVKVKLWAGPPPNGQPPYFVDDDPDNPNRRTDANGRFQFVVSGGAPHNPLDFFVQAVADDGQPQTEPIHFPFPAGEAQWVIVTASAPRSNVPSGQIPAIPSLALDPRLAADVGVTVKLVQPPSDGAYWKLISAQYQSPEEAMGNVNIVCYVQDEHGLPLPGAEVIQKWPDDQASATTDTRGHVDFPMTGDCSFSPERGEHGPYSAFVAGAPSDAAVGMGLPLKRHVQYILTWRRIAAMPTQPQQPSEPQPEPQPAPEPEPAPPPPAPKLFTHYLLFGPPAQPATTTNLILAVDYIVRFAPVVGFDPEQARFAEHVTIVGDTDAVGGSVETELRSAGCQVKRITASDTYALENLLKELVTSGSPYPT